MQTPVVSRYPAPAPIHNFVLLFLPPCGLHLTSLATESLELSLLVSPIPGGPARLRPFAPALRLHQRKSSGNLHLLYSTKSKSTPRCQSLITSRRDHPPVLRRSGPHRFMVSDLKPFVARGLHPGHNAPIKKSIFSNKALLFEKHNTNLNGKREKSHNRLSTLGQVLTPPWLYVRGSTIYVQDG
jgi:hypothetical protein